MRSIRSLLSFLLLTSATNAAITVHYAPGQAPLTATGSAAAAAYTGAAAYNPTVLNPPPIPNPPPAKQFNIQLNPNPGGLSVQQSSFFGFSIEMSVANQVLGKNSTLLQVPFLNLMANIQQRAGHVRVRVGGNTQETAQLVDSLPDGRFLVKELEGASNPTKTPPLDFTRDLLYAMRNISEMVNVRWFIGVPFFDAVNLKLEIAEWGQKILGDHLIGIQAGNEPDLYLRHGHRTAPYEPNNYIDEFDNLVKVMSSKPEHDINKKLLIGPNLATGDWRPEQIWDLGYVDRFNDNLAFLAVEHYPIDNCFAQFGVGTFHDPQETFPSFLSHTAGVELVKPYLGSTAYAQTKNKKFLMFETNSASCGGFAGISDSFGIGLWGLDYGLQMAYSNFTGALIHVGGQNVFYNPFTSPPTNQSTFRQWTIGPMYYSALIMAETLGAKNKSQVLDLFANNNNPFTPAYGIWEDGVPVRAALFNYMTDPSGNNDVTVSVNSNTPTVRVKYFLAPSVSTKGNFTWGNQTFGDHFASDGRIKGEEHHEVIQCNNGQCPVKLQAPSFALVFLSDSDDALTDKQGGPGSTYATTARTKTQNTATIEAAVLATSNGQKGMADVGLGSTSRGSANAARSSRIGGVMVGLMSVVVGAVILGRVR